MSFPSLNDCLTQSFCRLYSAASTTLEVSFGVLQLTVSEVAHRALKFDTEEELELSPREWGPIEVVPLPVSLKHEKNPSPTVIEEVKVVRRRKSDDLQFDMEL